MIIDSPHVNEDFLIAQTPVNLFSGFDITKVSLTCDNNQTVISDIFRVNDMRLSKDHLHDVVLLILIRQTVLHAISVTQ